MVDGLGDVTEYFLNNGIWIASGYTVGFLSRLAGAEHSRRDGQYRQNSSLENAGLSAGVTAAIDGVQYLAGLEDVLYEDPAFFLGAMAGMETVDVVYDKLMDNDVLAEGEELDDSLKRRAKQKNIGEKARTIVDELGHSNWAGHGYFRGWMAPKIDYHDNVTLRPFGLSKIEIKGTGDEGVVYREDPSAEGLEAVELYEPGDWEEAVDELYEEALEAA